MAGVRLQGATCIYRSRTEPAVDCMDLEVRDGELMVLLGPSGCGKSTVLRMVAGLEAVMEGDIFIGGAKVTTVAPKARRVGMVFQNYALYPQKTVSENLGLHLMFARVPKSDVERRVHEIAEILDLTPHLRSMPAVLSGGQAQRVAIGRALVGSPEVLLLDEPLSAVDAQIRALLRGHIMRLQRRFAVTMVYVTHDQVEAMTMGDRVAVMRNGQVEQCGTPEAVYGTPRNVFVAGFVGSPPMNLVRVPPGCREFSDALAETSAGPTMSGSDGRHVIIGVRPHDVSLCGHEGQVQGEVVSTEYLGGAAYVAVVAPVGRGLCASFTVQVEPGAIPRRGEIVRLGFGTVHVFDGETGEVISAECEEAKA